MYYWVLRELGAARTSMASYFAPLVGLSLGVLFLNERIDVRMILGALMILGGIAIVNLRFRRGPVIVERIALPEPVSPVN
jgi:drug/metabolite transporter (DMT)-like permease